MQDEQAQAYVDAYVQLNELFERKFGYSLFFIGGTLLGFVREGDFLKNDKDMDVAYLSKYSDPESVRGELFDIISSLAQEHKNVELVREEQTAVRTHFRWRVNSEVRIDVMPSWIASHDARLYYIRPTFVGAPADEDLLLPLKRDVFYGRQVHIPAQPENKLALVYGPDWRTPKGSIDKDALRSSVAKHELRTLAFRWKTMIRAIKSTEQGKQIAPHQFALIWFNSVFRGHRIREKLRFWR